tara:strand:- start:13870 stop:14178 length:309 start_codon:yes stop_codon:yes gene_type:complete
VEPTELITEAFSGVSAGLLLNVLILLVVYASWTAISTRIKAELLYQRIKGGSLGYLSRILYEGKQYKLTNLTRMSVELTNTDHKVYIPITQWEQLIKKIPTQ